MKPSPRKVTIVYGGPDVSASVICGGDAPLLRVDIDQIYKAKVSTTPASSAEWRWANIPGPD